MISQFFNMALALRLLLSVASTPTQGIRSQGTFSAKLYKTIANATINQNIIISPASVETCLALLYIGAEGETASEMRRGLNLGNDDVTKVQVAQKFQNLLSKMQLTDKFTIKMANRIYVQNGLQIATEFNDVAQRYFNSGAENVNFSDNKNTAKQINNWIEQQTENKITNAISSDLIDDKTAVLLVNAIYFKAKWQKTFQGSSTSKKDFHLSKTSTKKVDMMYQEDAFLYAELPYLDAKALSLRCIGTDIQMLVVLPNKLDGLGELEQQSKNVALPKVLSKLRMIPKVHVSLPKFKFEFDLSLVPVLKTLGMSDLFSVATANFSSLFTTERPIAIKDVLHKAFIEVNEAGTEAAAITAVKGGEGALIESSVNYEFNADHPFFFALMDNETVYFAGHVANI